MAGGAPPTRLNRPAGVARGRVARSRAGDWSGADHGLSPAWIRSKTATVSGAGRPPSSDASWRAIW